MAPESKKRKRTFAEQHHPEKPSAKFKPSPSKSLPSIAVALPGSILLNAQSDELKALLASQVCFALLFVQLRKAEKSR